MSELPIPHTLPVRFVKSLISSGEKSASVEIGFETIPSLAMLIEAAAQSSSGVSSDLSQQQMGFLTTLKNVKLLEELKAKNYIVDVQLDYAIQNFKSFSFSILDGDIVVVTGFFSISVQ